ncbi:MAG: hypothetical protein PHI98_16755 [Eubacteriales bacterium]|nr:hypothetical protein [Eubacteriales bacterium]
MNANRMKYASTPTYGMQKRGLLNKKTPVPSKAAEAPDFSRVPDQAVTMPAFFSTPVQQGEFPSMPYTAPTQPAYFPQGMSIPPMQGIPGAYPGSAYQNYSPIQPMGQQQPTWQSPLQSTASPAIPPLGNSVPATASFNGFSTRAQGFVPPQAQMNTPQGSGMPSISAAPAVQPAPYQAGAPLPNTQMYGSMPMMNGAPIMSASTPLGGAPAAPAMGYGAQNSYMAGQTTASFPPVQPPQAPVYPQATVHPKQQKPLDMNKLWSIFLFGMLPLLFIPCLFIPQSLNFIRYAFLVLSVCGMGGMWYRQMYGSATRMIISIAYVALCIVTVSMLMQGNRDLQQTSAGVPPSVQQSQSPDELLAAGAASPEVTLTPTPAPTTAGKSEAQMRLETFMSNWAGNRVEDMVVLVQPSWATVQDTPANRLFMLLGNRTPTDYTIEEISGTDEDTSRTVTMTATIDKNNGKDPSIYRFMVLMVKEGGEWYVDPNSLATNDQVETNEGNVVTSKDVGTATEAPRTTVSPSPPPSTMLYYNPDGGNYYHLDPNCESIKEEYRPLQGSFPYSELGILPESKSLLPCIKCGAPVETLPPEGE